MISHSEIEHSEFEEAPQLQAPKPWTAKIANPEADSHYNNVVSQLFETDVVTARQIAKLKLHYSQFVGQIDTPEKAIDHIRACYANNLPIGGSNEVILKEHKETPFGMTAEYAAELERLQAQAAEEARIAWKEAIQKRKAAMREWDVYVRNLHDRFAAYRDMSLINFEKTLKR